MSSLTELAQEEKQRLYADRIRQEELPRLRKELDELRFRLQELQLERGRLGERIESFLSHFNSFMAATATRDFKDATWDETDWLPRINGQEHTRALSAYNLVICVLAFHYSLLALKFDTPHPGFMIIDEPEQQKMRVDQFQIASENSEEVQIVVAATNKTGYENFLQPIDRRQKL
jgi:hypothetical protein